MQFLQLVKIFQKSHGILVFGNPLPVGSIGLTPKRLGRNVEINAINIHSLLSDEVV